MTAAADAPRPEFVAELRRLVERQLEVRRQALLLAGRAAGHVATLGGACQTCADRPWPCAKVRETAQPLLDAIGAADPDLPAPPTVRPRPLPPIVGDPLAPSACAFSWSAT